MGAGERRKGIGACGGEELKSWDFTQIASALHYG